MNRPRFELGTFCVHIHGFICSTAAKTNYATVGPPTHPQIGVNLEL